MADTLPLQVDVTVQDCFFEDTEPPIVSATWETWFQQWLDRLHPLLQAPYQSPIQQYELSLRLTNDAEMAALNGQYRNKNQATDVLSFASIEVDYPQVDEWSEQPLYLGDLVISVETAQRQAHERDHSLERELAWLASHGLLHLLGWDHPDESSLTAMLRQQESLMKTIGIEIQYDEAEI